MLVLTRKVGERILLGDDIEIAVISVRRDNVRLAISAPKHVSVYRSEVVERVKAENAAAARAAAVVRAGREAQRTASAGLLKPAPASADDESGGAAAAGTQPNRERRHAEA
jgi:carbon storage regulator